jgi:hypothetical protein
MREISVLFSSKKRSRFVNDFEAPPHEHEHEDFGPEDLCKGQLGV